MTSMIAETSTISSLFSELHSLEFSEDTFCQDLVAIVSHIKGLRTQFEQECFQDTFDYWFNDHGDRLASEILKNPHFTCILGFGCFYTSFLGRDGLVYKISTHRDRFDGSIPFIQAIHHSDNPLFPAIYQLATLDNDICFSTERLFCLRDGFFNKNNLFQLKYHIKLGEFSSFSETLEPFTLAYSSQIADCFKLITTLALTHDVKLDLREDNFMTRSDGSVVINDPLSIANSFDLY